MGTIRIDNVYRSFGTQTVLDGVSLELHSGEIVGLIGANGSGKTTLFNLIAGRIQPDKGVITKSKGMEVGYLPQEPEVDPDAALRDEVAGAFADLLATEQRMHALSERIAAAHGTPAEAELVRQYNRVRAEFETAGGYTFEQRLNEVLGGLGFVQADLDLPMSALSGGQRCRAALAKLLLSDSTFLLLDEPTNHLDIDAVRWLEKFLAGHHGGAVIVSHDRYLLDRLTERIVEVERNKLHSYAGNYSTYVKSKQVRLLTQQRQYEKDKAFIDKERDYIARYHFAQRSKQAKGRRTRLERRLGDGEFELESAASARSVRFGFERAEMKDAFVLRVNELAKRYDDKLLFSDVFFELVSGTRLGITGANGTGKTTLLRCILGQVTPDAGEITISPEADIGYYAQEAIELDDDATVLEEIRNTSGNLSEQQARNLLGGFQFTGDDVFKKLGTLSGGEQSRVRLIKLMLRSPNVLILDEPTNHLDIASREALEAALSDYPGTIIAVSHDRYFLDRMVDRLLVLRAGQHTLYNGNYSQYIEHVEQQRTVAAAQAPPARRGAQKRRAAAAERAARARQGGRPSAFGRLSLEELEALIMDREYRIDEFNHKFADPEVLRDKESVTKLRAEFDALKRELAEAERIWEEKVSRS